jgi:ubiquinone/menaquinone biosynthesis C-methylase UbiE
MRNEYFVGDFIYDAQIYDGFNTQTDDLAFYLKFFADHDIKKVLELCCGTGRLTIPLFESGINITGIDINQSMLDEAEKKSKDKGCPINFLHGDMRSFHLEEKFDAVFIPFNSIHHLYTNDDLFHTLQAVEDHLSKGGYLIIDYFNPSIRYIVESENGREKIAEYETQDGRKVVIHQTMKYENDTQINRIQWQFVINNKIHSSEALDMRIFYPKELDSYIETNQFKIIQKYGDYDRSGFVADSPKQLLVCQTARPRVD